MIKRPLSSQQRQLNAVKTPDSTKQSSVVRPTLRVIHFKHPHEYHFQFPRHLVILIIHV